MSGTRVIVCIDWHSEKRIRYPNAKSLRIFLKTDKATIKITDMNKQKATIKVLLLLSLLSGASTSVRGQLNPLDAQYFHNKYLANPAMAGWQGGWSLGGAVRKQWSMIPGSPVSSALTMDGLLSRRVGLGIGLYAEQSGLFRRGRKMASYAYHLPLDAHGSKLHFGMSIGVMDERLLNEGLKGNAGDNSLRRFTERDTYVDSDFGIAFVNEKLQLQAAVPNMKNFFSRDLSTMVDHSLFFASASYRWRGNSVAIAPLLAIRGVRGYKDLIDVGLELRMIEDQLAFSMIHHNSGSTTFGLGVDHRRRLAITGMYTTAASALRQYANGNFELAFNYRFFPN